MSTKITPFIKTKRLSTAIAMAVVGCSASVISTSSYAVNFGQTNIQSAQYEPLSATISINNMDEGDFKVSLANSAIYQQMGLTPNKNITVSFKRTSPTSGKIVLSSSKPINEPFADLVLDIKNSDKKQFMPKTLLMPMGKSAAVDNLKPQTIVATATRPNLPKVNPTPTVVAAKPNTDTVAKNNKLSNTATAKAPVTNMSMKNNGISNKGIPEGEFAQATRQAFLADQKNKQISTKAQTKKTETKKIETAQLNSKNTGKSEKIAAVKTKQPIAQPLPKPTQKQEAVKNNVAKNNAVKKPTKKLQPIVAKTNEPPIGQVNSDRLLLKALKATVAKDKTPKQVKPSKPKIKQRDNQKTKQQKPVSTKATGKATYVVQRNDNLWSIALEIAKRNKTNIHTVMKEIQQSNPQAFVHGKAEQLLANKTLVLPDYEVIPSQKSLQAAVASKKSQKHATSAKPKKKVSAKSKRKAKKTTKHTKYKAKSKPKAIKKHNTHKPKVSLVSPSTAKKPTKNSAAGPAKNKQLVAALKKKRQVAAKHASNVQQLNSKVSSYTQKLKLQNKKLAELEARLKKLKGQ